jgi:hypothetical protein
MYGQFGHPDSAAAAAAAAEMQGLGRVGTRAAAGIADQAYVQQQAALQALQVIPRWRGWRRTVMQAVLPSYAKASKGFMLVLHRFQPPNTGSCDTAIHQSYPPFLPTIPTHRSQPPDFAIMLQAGHRGMMTLAGNDDASYEEGEEEEDDSDSDASEGSEDQSVSSSRRRRVSLNIIYHWPCT